MLKRVIALIVITVFTVSLSIAGTIRGRVTSAETKTPVAGASVAVVGTSFGAATDDEGEFAILRIPAGTYKVRASAVGFKENLNDPVSLGADQTIKIEIVLEPTVVKLKSAEIRANARKGSVEREITERLSSASITDGLSSEAIKAMPDPDVAQVVRRATGVSLMGGDPIIRGLGVRYSKITLNNAQIAGTEPNRSGVSLDLFPASMMQAVKVRKSYEADQFGEFGGGVIDMCAWDFTGGANMTVSYGLGFNSATTFKTGRTYNGGSYDFLGFDDGRRALPDYIENADAYMNIGRAPYGISRDSLKTAALSLRNNWNPKTYKAPPNQDVSFSYANRGRLFGRDLSYLVSGLYKHAEIHCAEVDSSFQKANAEGKLRNEYWWNIDSWTRSAALGLLTNLKYDFTPLHSLDFSGMINRDADDETRYYESYNEDFGGSIRDNRFRFIIRNVSTGQLAGRHVFPGLGNSVFNWQATASEGSRYEPDTREVQFRQREGRANYEFSNDAQSGSRFYYDLVETSTHYDFNWLYPLGESRFKLGTALVNRHRDAPGRWLKMQVIGNTAAYVDMDNPEEIFDSTNIASGKVRLTELPRDNQNYNASQYIRAVYATSDVPLTDRLKVIAGLRHESTIQTVVSTVPLIQPPRATVARFAVEDFLPSLNLVYKLAPKSNLRFAASQTISRPDFREMSKYEFNDVIGGYAVVGDTTLTRALIRSFDLRYEASTERSELFSFSLFYKNFFRPIETVIDLQQQNRMTFANAKGAEVGGIEVEAMERLGEYWERLKNFSVSTNLTLSYSRIHLEGAKAVLQNKNRPLQGQSPYLFNFNLHYTEPVWKTNADLFFNIFGRRISEVGLELPDIYEMPHPSLDLTVRQPVGANWTYKLAVSNILDPEITTVQHDNQLNRDAKVSSYHSGVGVSIGVSYHR